MTVVRNGTHTHMSTPEVSVGSGLSLVFVRLIRFSILCFFLA